MTLASGILLSDIAATSKRKMTVAKNLHVAARQLFERYALFDPEKLPSGDIASHGKLSRVSFPVRLTSAQQIAKMGDDNSTYRTHKVADREDAESLNLAQPIRDLRRKEQLSQCLRKENENDKVVELQGPAERSQGKGPIVVRGQWTLGGEPGT